MHSVVALAQARLEYTKKEYAQLDASSHTCRSKLNSASISTERRVALMLHLLSARREGLSPFRFPDYNPAPRHAPRGMGILYQNPRRLRRRSFAWKSPGLLPGAEGFFQCGETFRGPPAKARARSRKCHHCCLYCFHCLVPISLSRPLRSRAPYDIILADFDIRPQPADGGKA